MQEIKTVIQLRHDTTENWNKTAGKATKLQPGEFAVEIGESGKTKVKIGTEVDQAYEDALYFGSEPTQVYQSEEISVNDTRSDEEIIAALTGEVELHNGDCAIIKREITEGGALSYTSYVYDDGNWAAMDGNYSASNVFLKNKIELAGSFTSIGNYEKGKTINAGTSLEALLSGMLQQELYPNANDVPNAQIDASGGSGEVGTNYSAPTATLKITDVGSYAYGPATGITFAIGDVKIAEGAEPSSATNFKTNESVMAKDSTLTLTATSGGMYSDSSKSYTFSGSASYGAGAIPITNLGNAYANAQIPAGSVSIADKTITFSGYRYAFAGGSNAAVIDSAVVRSMTAKKSSKGSMDAESEALEFTVAAGATKVFFAYPATWTGTPYFEMFGLAWGENTDIVAKNNIQVADARGTVNGELQGAVAYKLYCWELDTPLQAESTKFRVWFK